MKIRFFSAIKRISAGVLLFAFLVSGLTACDREGGQDNVVTASPEAQGDQDNVNTASPEVQGDQKNANTASPEAQGDQKNVNTTSPEAQGDQNSVITDPPEEQEQEEHDLGYEVKKKVVHVSGNTHFGYSFDSDSETTNGVVLWYVDGEDAEKMFIEKNVHLKWLEDDLEDDISNYSSNVAGCPFLTEIDVEEGNRSLYAKDGLLFAYDLHGENGLYACPMAKKGNIKIPDGEKIIWSCAFNGCSEITSVYIPKSIQGIGDAAFGDMISCQAIRVSEKNRYYKSVDGVLYTKDGKVLLAYPAGKKQKEFQIPQGVKYIASGAFMRADYLEKVILPKSVKYIHESAFRTCGSLSSVKIKGELEYLDDKAFCECYYINNKKKLPEPDYSYDKPEDEWRYKYKYFGLNSKNWITGFRGLGK